MLSRRTLLTFSAIVLSTSALTAAALADETKVAGPVLGDDGLYHQDWFLDSFLELKDDLVETTEKNKRLAIFWELKGCPYCKETHFKNFARPDISKFIRGNFEILQLNVLGSRMVTDLDGQELTEKALASKYGVRFTPTIQFFHDDVDKIAKLKPRKREVTRIQGYLQPDHFLAMFQYVQLRAYEKMSFRKFVKAKQLF